MAFTSGFFNAVNGDRKYDAVQMSKLFDGLITEGIYAHIGGKMVPRIRTDSPARIDILPGRAWFLGTWSLNDSIYTINLGSPTVGLNRWDALVLDVNIADDIRENKFAIVNGIPATNPVRPSLANIQTRKQIPLAYIYRAMNVEIPSESDLYITVGSTEAPFVTGILQGISNSEVVARWESEWASWLTGVKSTTTQELQEWKAQQQQAFNTWFSGLKVTLSGDTAANLTNKILRIEEKLNLIETKQTLYPVLTDSAGQSVLDNTNDPIISKLKLALV